MAEILKAGDGEATAEEEPEDMFAEEYEPASMKDEAKMLENMDFAIQELGEVATKVQDLVNFVNPYCGTEVNESGEQPKFKVGDVVKVMGVSGMDFYGRDAPIGSIVKIEPPHPDVGVYEYLIKGRSGEFFAYEDELELVPERFTEEENSKMKKITKERGCCGLEPDYDDLPDDWGSWNNYDGDEDDEGYDADSADYELSDDERRESWRGRHPYLEKGKDDGGPWLSEKEIIGMKVTGEAGGDNLDAEEFIDMMTNGAGATPLFDPYNGEQEKDGTVVLNVIAHREQVSYKDVQDGFAEQAAEYGWEFKSFGYSDDLTSGMVDDGNVEIDVVFAPMQQVSENLENELKKGDDGWTTIGQPVGESKVSITPEMKKKIEEYALRDWRLSKWKSNKGFREIYELTKYIKDNKVSIKDDKIYVAGEEVGEIVRSYSSRRVNLAYQELKPKIKWYDNVVSEATVVVDADTVWDVLELLDDDEANKNLTDLINSHVRTEEEIMDAIEGVIGDMGITSTAISKSTLNGMFAAENIHELISMLNLDVDAYMDRGVIQDADKPTSVELESDHKFNVGDKITWRHHNGSLSNEIVRELIDGGYIVDDGAAGEKECYPGHVPEELLYKSNMEWDGNGWRQGIGFAENAEDGQKPEEVKSQDKTFNQDGENKTLVTGEEKKKEMSDAEAATIMGGASATDMDAADIGVSSHKVADPYKKPVCEMTIEQEVPSPQALSNMLWGQGKENLEELLQADVVDDGSIMQTIEDMGLRNLTEINDYFSFDFENLLESLGCDPDAWAERLEIVKKGGEEPVDEAKKKKVAGDPEA